VSGRHYIDTGASVRRVLGQVATTVGTWCNRWVPPAEATTIPGAVRCEDCKAAMSGGTAAAPRMIDGAIKAAVEETLQFLRLGQTYTCLVDEHEIDIVRIDPDGMDMKSREYLIACATCSRLVARSVQHRRAFLEIHKHTEEPISG
jgi:hypothetical protein